MRLSTDDGLVVVSVLAGVSLVAFGGGLASQRVELPAGLDWPAWVQAVGSLIAIAIAIAVPAWQHTRDVNRVRQEQEDLFWLAVQLLGVVAGTLQATSQRYQLGETVDQEGHTQNARRLASLSAALQGVSLTELKPSTAAAEFLLGQTALWRAERRLSCLRKLLSEAESDRLAAGLSRDFKLCRTRIDRMCVARTGHPLAAHDGRFRAEHDKLPPVESHLDSYWEAEDWFEGDLVAEGDHQDTQAAETVPPKARRTARKAGSRRSRPKPPSQA